MKIWIFGKEAHTIRAQAKSEERAKQEAHWLDELRKAQRIYSDDVEKTRKANLDAQERVRKNNAAEMKTLENNLEKYYYEIIGELHKIIADKSAKLQNSQEAWNLFKNMLPQIKNYASMLQAKAQANAEAKARDLAMTNQIDNDLESFQRTMRQITPEVDKLLCMAQPPKMIKRKE